MIEHILTLGADGAARDIGGQGFGFRVVPARATSAPVTVRPGSYPITVRVDGGRTFQVTADDSRFLEEPFRFLELVDGQASDSWKVQVFEARREAVLPPGQRGSVAARVQAATATPTAAPSGTDGIKIRPGTRFHTFYASGTLQAGRLWVRTAGGTWIDTLEDLDFVTTPVITRAVWASADRLYIRTAAATMTLEIDAEVEVG